MHSTASPPRTFVRSLLHLLLVITVLVVQLVPTLAFAAPAVSSPNKQLYQEPTPPVSSDDLSPVDQIPVNQTAVSVTPNADAQKSLGVIINLETDLSILTPEATANVTVTVRAEAAIETDKAILTLHLPKELIAPEDDKKNKLQWNLPLLNAGDIFQRQVQLQIAKLNQALKRGVGTLTATVDAPAYARLEAAILLAFAPAPPNNEDTLDDTGAIIASSDGEVLLLAPPTAAPNGVRFRYTELYNWETLTTTLPAPTTVEPTQSTLSLTSMAPLTATAPITPALATNNSPLATPTTAATDSPLATPTIEETAPAMPTVGSATPRVRVDHNLDAYRLWQFDALQDGADLHLLGGEVFVQVSVKKLVEAGIDPISLNLWTREGAEGRWTPVPTVYDAKQQRLQAWLPHFSQFGLGAGLQQSGDMLPSVKAFTVDQLNGGASVSIPMETPKGLGGLSPSLSLSYSSITMDDLFREAGSADIEGQAGSAGIGWHLGGVSYIARTDNRYDNNNPDTEKKFALVLNGTRVSISFQDGLWRTNPEIFAKIIWPGANSHTGNQQYQAHDYSPWTIWTADGTKYEFGDAGTFPNAFSSISPTGTSLERTFGNQTFRVTKRWYLRKVTDPLGNSMEYSYQGEQGWEQGCVDAGWVSAGQHWYTRAIDPSAIHWSGQSGGYTMRVLFSYTSRGDTHITGNGTNDCLQPLYGSSNRLTTVTVQVLSGGGWHTMRSYSLGQGTYGFANSRNRLYLSHLDHLGENGGQLIRYSFGYNPLNPNRILLTSASNSLGGSATYTYSTVRASCSNSTCPFTMDRYAVTRYVTGDGQSNTRTVDHYYGPGTVGDEWSAVGDDGGFMGYKEVQSKYYATNSTSSELRRERLLSYSSGAAADRDNPDPRRGKLLRRELWTQSTGGTLLQATDYDWKAYWLENGGWQSTPTAASWRVINNNVVYPITWIRLEKETQTTGSAVNEKRYTYEGTYGNQTQMAEWADGSLQRTTNTEYFPNSSNWVVNKPARVRILDSGGTCRAETRMVYDGNGTTYNAVPTQGLVRRIQRALTGCDTVASIADTNNNWQVSYFEYNSFGNQTRATEFGNSTAQDVTIRTTYETTYNLFPVEQWYDAGPNHKETALYYGVNGLAVSDGKAFWGAMQEHCGVNDICTRQSYDQFGRRIYRWEAVAKGSAWGADSAAQVFWDYTPFGGSQTATTILEWRNPRSEGNFVRQIYNGWGELIQEQRPYQDWTSASGQEVFVDYQYDALGRQTRVGIPWLAAKYTGGSANTLRATTWVNGFTATSYDTIDRPTVVTAPNGEQQQYGYVARQMSITGIGRNGDPNKILKWQETNGLGYLREVRTYNPSGSSWTLDGQIILTHNVLGNLTQVNHVGIGTSSFTYDVGGRKTAMSDINLGNWGYGYDRQGKLTRQTDARNATICLYYDGMARLTGKHFRWDTACPASPSMSVSYGYDAGHSASNPSRGQLTSTSNSGYSKALTYNSRGLLHQETVSISGPATYVTSYGYDADLRPTTVTYPDAEIVTTGYNSMGLPSWLHSNVGGNLIDSVTYDEAGRLTQRRASHNGQFYSQTYWPWTGASSNTNGRLKEIRLGSSSGASNLLYLLYGYDSFGNIGGMNEQYNGGATNSFTFCYDALNRLIRGYTPFNANLTCATHTGGRTYSYDSAGRLTNYEGAAMTAGGLKAHLSLPAGSYAVDSNGNLTNRLAQSLTWNHENRLESYYRATPYLYETYLYDVDGIRVRKTTNGVNTFYANRFYEQTGSAITKYYYFGGQRVAMRQGHTTPLIYLYGDHVGSTAYTTHDGGTFITEQGYWGYGRHRRGGALPTDHRFTGQKLDGSGLMYYNARYYDPDLGQFISPDPLVPDPTNLFAYNRYMYVAGNPMKYADPTGHWLESGLDIISLGLTVKDINDNGLNWENGIGLAADVTSLVLPGVAGGGTVVRYADDAYAAGKAGVSTAWDWGKQALGYGDEAADTAVDAGKAADNIPCPVNSFSAETLVATETGLQPITEVDEGELVYAYNEATGEVGLYPVTDEIAHLDHEIVTVVIEGERIYTTPEHPFYVNGQWIDAGQLSVGNLVRQLDGSAGDVEAITLEERPQVMYNLTVAEAHTFFVGEQQWLVHNCKGWVDPVTGWKFNPNVDSDWRGTGKGASDALNEAFSRTGVSRDQFEVTQWSKDVYGKSHPVEWTVKSGPNAGAQVNMDWGHRGNPSGPSMPHVGYQTGGKRYQSGASRGHILLDSVPYTRP